MILIKLSQFSIENYKIFLRALSVILEEYIEEGTVILSRQLLDITLTAQSLKNKGDKTNFNKTLK